MLNYDDNRDNIMNQYDNRTNMHVFVAMPFGVKEGIDFNNVYNNFVKPALIDEGFEVFRADEELSAGDIRTDMFQESLLADLVVVDLLPQ